jgi:hypothetical protein
MAHRRSASDRTLLLPEAATTIWLASHRLTGSCWWTTWIETRDSVLEFAAGFVRIFAARVHAAEAMGPVRFGDSTLQYGPQAQGVGEECTELLTARHQVGGTIGFGASLLFCFVWFQFASVSVSVLVLVLVDFVFGVFLWYRFCFRFRFWFPLLVLVWVWLWYWMFFLFCFYVFGPYPSPCFD